MRMITKKRLLIIALLFCSGSILAQRPGNRAPGDTASANTDTSKSAKARPVSKGPRPYSEIITAKAKTSLGMFKVHFLDDKYFLRYQKVY